MGVQRLLGVVGLVVGVAASVGALAATHARAVFLSGAPAPPGLTFASFGRAATNAGGSVAFLAGWDAVGQRREGLYLRRGTEVAPVVRAGDPVPGGGRSGGPERFSLVPEYGDEFAAFSLNDRDEVAFIVRQGLFLYAHGEVLPVARVGDELPGVLGEQWEEIFAVSMNNDGAIAFAAATRSTGDGERHEGVFLLEGGDLEIVLFAGDEVAGLEGELVRLSSVSLNAQGEIAALARFGEEERAAILFSSGQETRVVAAQGGTAPGGVWTELGSAALNDDGAIAFQARVTGSAVERDGIYLAANGAVAPIAVPGQSVSGVEGAKLGDSLARPALAEDGAVAFVAELVAPGGSPVTSPAAGIHAVGSALHPRALVQAAEGRLTVLALEGRAAPGDAGGTVTGFSGLHLESMGRDGVVCGVAGSGGAVSDRVIRFSLAAAPEVLLTTAAPLPPGSALSLVDGETDVRTAQAQINGRGEVVFAADGGGYGRALFRSGGSDPELLTPLGRTGTGGVIRSVRAFALNDAGQIAYVAVREVEGQEAAVLRGSVKEPGAAQVIAETGQGVPGVPDRVITGFGAVGIDGRGDVLFVALGEAAAVGQGDGAISEIGSSPPPVTKAYLVRATGGRLELAAGEGQPVEGVGALAGHPSDALDGTVPGTFRELQVNEAGQALFLSSYRDAATGVFVPAGLFLLSDGEVRPVALPGQPAPLPRGPTLFSFSAPRLSDGGAIAFLATVVGGGRAARPVLFRSEAEVAVPLAVGGDPVPGVDDATYRSLASPAINAAGDLAFYALLDRPAPPPPSTERPRRTGAILVSTRGATRVALTDGVPLESQAEAALRLDDTPAAPLTILEDGTLLLAARLRNGTAADGLFLVPVVE